MDDQNESSKQGEQSEVDAFTEGMLGLRLRNSGSTVLRALRRRGPLQEDRLKEMEQYLLRPRGPSLRPIELLLREVEEDLLRPRGPSLREILEEYIDKFVELVFLFISVSRALVRQSFGLLLLLFSLPLIHRFADLAPTLNGSALVFVLGSYGLVLSNPLFWMCWTILVIKAVIYNSIQPYWEWIESKGTRADHGKGRAIIFKLEMCTILFALLLCSQDITQRQNTILLIVAASLILFEGLTPLSIGREEFSLRSTTECQKCQALIFFSPSALNAMISITGPIVLGGDLGQLLRKEAFWGFTFLFLVDVFAEVFSRSDNDRRSPPVMSEDFPKTHPVVVVLRVIVEGCLCWWMSEVIYEDSYFPSDLGIDDCSKLCRERSKHLLITMVALGGLQAAGTLFCVLVHRHHPTLLFFLRLDSPFP